MSDYILSVWQAGDHPPDGGALLRLSEMGGGLVAEHAAGFDTSAFRHNGVVIDPEGSLSAAGLMDVPRRESVGDSLWARLTPGPIGPALTRVAGTARIYLDLRSAELKRYPWELLRLGGRDIFTAANARWCLGHPERTRPFGAGDPPPAEHPLRVLVVLGNRPDDRNIRARQELMLIEREAHRHNTDVLLKTLFYPAAADIETALEKFRPHVFHFIGHGGSDGTEPAQIYVYSSEAGISEPWSASRVQTVFSQAPPRIVVLNACLTAHTPTQATSLADAFTNAGCIATVAMLGEILGSASEAFSERLYQELFAGQPIDTATTRARLEVGAIAGGDQSAAQLRSNWPLPRVTVNGDADTAVTMLHATRPGATTWLQADFVTRWDERWRAWKTMDGSLKGDRGTESRLVVLSGDKDAGKRELLNTLAEVRARAGDAVLYVDLSGGRTGSWRDLLERIADQAAQVGFDAAALQAVAASAGTSAEVIPEFLAHLESLQRHGADAGEPLLIVLDGLSDWAADEVRNTVLPKLCWPLVQASPHSRLRMMISLRDGIIDDTWGARPLGWTPVTVGDFDVDEWERAVEHFRDHWLEQIRDRKPAKVGDYSRAADVYRPFRLAVGLDNLRSLAEAILR
jgi:CHAT domain-containing protein